MAESSGAQGFSSAAGCHQAGPGGALTSLHRLSCHCTSSSVNETRSSVGLVDGALSAYSEILLCSPAVQLCLLSPSDL